MIPTKYGDIYFDISKLYTLKNMDFDIGYLSYTYEESHSGHYLQYLCDGAYNNEYQYYEPDNKWRNSVLWEIKPVPDDEGPYFTLRNKALDYGYLSVTNYKSASGYYVEHLYSNAYDQEKKLYEKGEKLHDLTLWMIDLSDNGCYTLTNKALQGFLSYTQKRAKSGNYIQVLCGKDYEEDKEKYAKGQIWEKSISWQIKPAIK